MLNTVNQPVIIQEAFLTFRSLGGGLLGAREGTGIGTGDLLKGILDGPNEPGIEPQISV